MESEYNPKVLIVDDNPDILRAISSMLRKTGFGIIQAETGHECLKKTNHEHPDIIILDINLPDQNGYEICRLIKENPETSGIFILFASAVNITPLDQTKAFESGAEGFIIHPFSQNELMARLTPLVRLVQIEKRNQDIMRRLRESESKYQALVENSPDIIAIIQGGRFIYLNKSGFKFFGIESANNLVQNALDNFFGSEKTSVFLTNINNVLNTGEILHTEEHVSLNTGEVIPLAVSFVPVQHGGAPAVQVIGRDITPQMQEHEKLEKYSKELEEKIELRVKELKEKSVKLEESQRALTYLLEDVNESRLELETANRNLISVNRELEAFTYTVSHDLRAPIRAIDGFSRILLEENFDQLDDEGKRLLGIIVNSAAKMQHLIDDLLAFSRLGSKQPARHQIDSNALISQVIEEVKASYPNRKINWQLAELPMIYGDQGMLRQVFANIIGNAVKFTAKREVAEIEIGGKSESSLVHIFIKDNGVGFEMKYSQKIFEVFQRLHDSKDFEGTGIGLAIVKKILDKHNGRIIPQSEPGKGSVFTLILPLT